MGARIARLAGPHDVAHAADRLVLGMDRLDLLVDQPAHDRRQAQHVAGRHRLRGRRSSSAARGSRSSCRHRRCRRRARPMPGTSTVDIGRREIRGDVGDPHALDEAALLLVARHDAAGRRVDVEHARRRRRHQPVLDRHGDGADRAVAAHRQAAADLDEQDADVAIGARRRIEDRARHHVVAARLEHQRLADPVVVGEEIEPPLAHGRALEQRPAARHQPHRIAAGMAVEAGEGVHRHAACLRRLQEALNLARAGQAHDRLVLAQELAFDGEARAVACDGSSSPTAGSTGG